MKGRSTEKIGGLVITYYDPGSLKEEDLNEDICAARVEALTH